jgi:hypothetical protein
MLVYFLNNQTLSLIVYYFNVSLTQLISCVRLTLNNKL